MRRRYHQSAIDVGLQLFSSLKRQIFVRLQQCPEDYHYVLPVGGFGELVFTLSQSHHLRQQGKVCMLLREDRAYLSRLWPEAADHFMFLNQQQFDLLRSLEAFSYRSPGWLYICWADLFADGRFGLDLVLNNNRLTMKEMYSYALGLKFDVPVAPPVVGHLNVQLPGNGRKNILVIQHANTISRIPGEFWVALTQRLVQHGYNLLVDVIADTDVIAGSPPEVRYFRTQVPELLGLARAADAMIALRSGMADLIGAMLTQPGTSKMLVLYHVTAAFGDGPRSFHHSPGISRSGLNLSKSYSTDRSIDVEVASDDRARLIADEADRIADLAVAAAG
jgi:hypothetical protein